MMRPGGFMTRTIITILALSIVLSLIVTSVSAQGMDEMPPHGEGMDYPGPPDWNLTNGTWDDGISLLGEPPAEGVDDRLDEMFRAGMRHGLFGRFSVADGEVEGAFISFGIDGGMITDYSVKVGAQTITVFESVTVEGDLQRNETRGSIAVLTGEDVRLVIHDNPTGMVQVTSSASTQISFLLADGMLASDDPYRAGQGPERVIVHAEEFVGVLMTEDGAIVVDAGASDTWINVTVEEGSAIFRALPMLEDRNRIMERTVMGAILDGRVGGEVSIVVRNGTALVNTMEYTHQFHINVTKAERNRIVMEVRADQPEGKVVIINIDRESLQLDGRELSVKVDGREMDEVEELADVLYPSSFENGCYGLIKSEEYTQVLVYLPSFSTHMVEIDSVDPLFEVLGIKGVVASVAGIGLIALAAAFLVTRRND